MKKILAILVFVLIGTISFAQQWTNGTGNDIYKTTMPGKVGIGLTAPLYTLHLYEPSTAAAVSFLESNRTDNNKTIAAFQLKATATGDQYLMSMRKYNGTIELLQSCYISTAPAGWVEFVVLNYNTRKYEMRSGVIDAEFKNAGKLLFNNTGAVGIGTGATAIPAGTKLAIAGTVGIGMGSTVVPSGALLAVNGKLVCKEIEVTMTGFPDFVFQKDYKLRSLSEVEDFVGKNKHLPDIPSESEVKAKGLNLGQMDALLLQKIEELTLYMIDLKKENQQLKDRIKKIER